MKKILFITPFTPDNQGAGVSYTSQLLKELSKTCLIDLVYFRYKRNNCYVAPNGNISVICEEVIRTRDKIHALFLQPGFFPLFTARYSKRVCKFLQDRVNSNHYDYVYFDFSQTFSYARHIKHPNKILMAHDVIAQKYSRMKTYLKPWASRTEKKMLQYGNAVFTFSEKDCQLIEQLYGIEAMSTTFFLNENVVRANPEIESDYFVFFGSWGRSENSEALRWFMDNVSDKLPSDIKFKVIGGNLPEDLKEKLKNNPVFVYLGFVDNPYPVIANARAEIAPLHMGAGVKVKCIEALGCGTPIIGTEVAFEGIGDQYREAMFEANSVDEYVKMLKTFNYSFEKKKQLKAYFLENYNNKQILKYING